MADSPRAYAGPAAGEAEGEHARSPRPSVTAPSTAPRCSVEVMPEDAHDAAPRAPAPPVSATEPARTSSLDGPAAQQQAPNVGSGDKFISRSDSSFILFHRATPLLIDPRKVDDFRRYRILFLAFMALLASSTNALFPVLALSFFSTGLLDVEHLVNCFTIATTIGLIAFPFGMAYDFFGPRPVVAVATIFLFVGNLMIGLMIGKHVKFSYTLFCVFFTFVNVGSYAMDVAVLPAVITHTPRNRGYPTGFLKVFSSLCVSLFACLYRGFFPNRLDNLMYFSSVFVFIFGGLALFIGNAPYVVSRLEARHLTPKDDFKLFLLRNRYMSQLLPRRRILIINFTLLTLNVFLAIQSVCGAWLVESMTLEKYRALAIVAVVLLALLLVTIVPLKALDGPSLQDEAVQEAAKHREEELAEKHKQIQQQQLQQQEEEAGPQPTAARVTVRDESNAVNGESYSSSDEGMSVLTIRSPERSVGNSPLAPGSTLASRTPRASHFARGNQRNVRQRIVRPPVISSHENSPRMDQSARHDSYYPSASESVLLEVSIIPGDEATEQRGELALQTRDGLQLTLRNDTVEVASVSTPRPRNPLTTSNEPIVVNNHNWVVGQLRNHPSKDKDPYVETINVCNDVYVSPVYQTTFLESLCRPDIWLLMWNTAVMWSIGLTLTSQWNVYILLSGLKNEFDYKNYVLFSALSGIAVAAGRLTLGIYELLLPAMRQKTGLTLAYTLGITFGPVLMIISIILFLAVPGNYALIPAFMISSCAYGLASSFTPYVVGGIFERDIGMHYGFCFFGSAVMFFVMHRFTMYEVYKRHAQPIPQLRGLCKSEKACTQNTFIVFLVLSVTALASGILLHYRYWKLVHGKLEMKRVWKQGMPRRAYPIDNGANEKENVSETIPFGTRQDE